jgi:hypothetical protein
MNSFNFSSGGKVKNFSNFHLKRIFYRKVEKVEKGKAKRMYRPSFTN